MVRYKEETFLAKPGYWEPFVSWAASFCLRGKKPWVNEYFNKTPKGRLVYLLEKVVIIDMGGGEPQLLARKVREFKVYCEIVPCDISREKLLGTAPKALILSGNSSSDQNKTAARTAVDFHCLGLPVLEVSAAPSDDQKLRDFLYNTCGLSGSWTMKSFVESSIAEIREKAGPHGKAICGLSGGIDSAVAALLVHRAIGDRLTCIFVDHGLLRKGEKEQVIATFREEFNMKLVAVDAGSEFLALLQGVTDPEEKRKIIGNHFIRVFEREADKIKGVTYLVQGTIYPDIIESGTASAAVIKSHHNVGGLPDDMKLSLIEPLKYLFKDEVRLAALELGLPEDVVWRHPFPGPGLAVRVLGEVTPEKVSILQEADAIVIEEIKKAGLYRKIWQAFAVLPDILSVGIKNNKRVYAHTIVLRSVTSQDAMTAACYPIPYEVLEIISTRLTTEIPEVTRFVYDLTPKPPGTIEWE